MDSEEERGMIECSVPGVKVSLRSVCMHWMMMMMTTTQTFALEVEFTLAYLFTVFTNDDVTRTVARYTPLYTDKILLGIGKKTSWAESNLPIMTLLCPD